MDITQMLYKAFLDCKQSVQESFYYWRQDRFEKEYRKLAAKWNEVSRQCYALEQRLRRCSGSVYNSVLEQYNEARAKAQKLSEKVKSLSEQRIR